MITTRYWRTELDAVEHVFVVDYSDGAYFVRPCEDRHRQDPYWAARILKMTPEEHARWEAFQKEEARWQERFREIDNAADTAPSTLEEP